MSKNNLEILTSFLSAELSILEDSNTEILQNLFSVVDEYLKGNTEADFNTQIEQVLKEDDAHAEYLRDLIADIYFQEDTNDAVKSKIILISNSNILLKEEIEFRTDIRKLYLIENRPAFKKKLQELTEREVAATASYAPAASINPGISYFKPLAIAASILLVVVIGYFLFRNPQQTQIAKLDTKKNIDSIAVPEYKKMIIITEGNQNSIGFAGEGSAVITDSLAVGILKDTINAYKLWEDTLIIRTNKNADGITIIREVSTASDKMYLKINSEKYQIMESEEYLLLEAR